MTYDEASANTVLTSPTCACAMTTSTRHFLRRVCGLRIDSSCRQWPYAFLTSASVGPREKELRPLAEELAKRNKDFLASSTIRSTGKKYRKCVRIREMCGAAPEDLIVPWSRSRLPKAQRAGRNEQKSAVYLGGEARLSWGGRYADRHKAFAEMETSTTTFASSGNGFSDVRV